MAKPHTRSIDSDGMENVELHRAESISEPALETVKEKEILPSVHNNVFTRISFVTSSILSEIKQLRIELVLFLYMFSYVVRAVSSTSMIMDKVCLVHFGEPKEICSDLKNHLDIKHKVEKLANNYHVGHSMIQMLPSSILSCFIGAWSDKYGRKPPIIASLLGITLDGLGSTICAGIFYSRVEYYLIPAIFTGFSGGFIGVLTVIYSYASDVTSFRQRTMKYAIMEVFFGLSLPLGQLTGGWVFKYSGYFPVFVISTCGHVLCLAFVIFLIKETKGLDNQDSWRVKLRNLWSTEPAIQSFKATIKRRPHRGREQILLLILSMSVIVLAYTSTVGISFIYAHEMYDWNNTQYSTVSAIFTIIGTITTFISVPIFKKIGLGDPALGIVGCSSILFKYIALGLATKVWVYYLGNFLGLLAGLSTLASRSRISKVSSKNDIGKVFAFLTTAESFLPIIATAIVSQVFNASLDIYPGLIFLIIGILSTVSLGVFIWLARLPDADYEEMHNNSQENEDIEQPVGKIQEKA
ncbi:MFS domain-containing protein [Trichonephila inaurata madagascariensis]|uniref:MFS domain-containing protein n=1 Tax=Trichonephila inaurata madagascariensis TaxID=2747483 RepID=A0A8X6XU91_9ARAC|nr:MFS domain-containing protein [Trichonephila inaurata madagascariensis]